MEFAFSPAEEALRLEVRSFLQAEPRHETVDSEDTPNTDVERALARNGWLTMAWPKEYGGRGASQIEQLIFKEELFEAGGAFDFLGVQLAGATIMVHGNDEQKRTHSRASPGPRCDGARGSQSRAPGATSPVSRHAPSGTATTTLSMARRSGLPTHTTPTGSCS